MQQDMAIALTKDKDRCLANKKKHGHVDIREVFKTKSSWMWIASSPGWITTSFPAYSSQMKLVISTTFQKGYSTNRDRIYQNTFIPEALIRSRTRTPAGNSSTVLIDRLP